MQEELMEAEELSVIPVVTTRQLRRFARFNVRLYRNHPYSVPDLIGDTINSFKPSRNAAFEFCEAQPFIAVMDGRIVGRVAAIINHRANEVWKVRTVRFGWIDFIDDFRVSGALLDAVAEWGKERGMNRLEGPFGFTDFDPEGMLTEGFDRIGTMATIYNYPYYPVHMERLGLTKSAGWVEWMVHFSSTVPPKIDRISKIVLERNNLHVPLFAQSKHREARTYAFKLFELVNESYMPLYGYSAFSDRQIRNFVKRYLFMLDKRLAAIVLDSDDNVVAAALTMSSIAEALQKAKGHLLPTGWWHLLKALKCKRSHVVESLFIAVKPKYQNKGLTAILLRELGVNASGAGYRLAESNPELEDNKRIQNHWEYYEGSEIIKRRAVFCKRI